jgi:hypothetical protein
LFDGDYFKKFGRFDHYTVVIDGLIPQSTSAEFAARLRAWFRKNTNRRARMDAVAKEILAELGYELVKVCIVEDIDYTDTDFTP